jgi:hypothetical protein
MNNKFDELAKGLAQSVTRRQALKRFCLGLAGMALACVGLANKAEASPCDPTTSCCCSGCHTQVPKSYPTYSFCAQQCCLRIRCWGQGPCA